LSLKETGDGVMENESHNPDWHWLFRSVDTAAPGARTEHDPCPVPSLGQRTSRKVHFPPEPEDIIAQCPKCKTIETVQFIGSTLTRCRKFSQRDGYVYHDCGSPQPCRLHAIGRSKVG